VAARGQDKRYGIATGVLGRATVVIGRAELFTENFLIPVGTVFAGRSSVSNLLRMWGVSLVVNFASILAFGAALDRRRARDLDAQGRRNGGRHAR